MTYYPSGISYPIEAEDTLNPRCQDPTGLRGRSTENGTFDMSCRVDNSGGGFTRVLTVSGSLSEE